MIQHKKLPKPARKMIHLPKVIERSGKSRTTIWRDVRAGLFPAPVRTGPNRIAWYEDEVIAWQEKLPRIWHPAEEVTQEAAV